MQPLQGRLSHSEDDCYNIRRKAGTASTHGTTKPRKLKLHIITGRERLRPV